jgi:hypothetical protein
MTSITERVAAGAAFQDEHDPDWWRAGVERAIDLEVLSLGSGDTCVLGQRCPLKVWEQRAESWMSPFCAQAAGLTGLAPDGQRLNDWAAECGFMAAEDTDSDEEYDALTAEWKRLITERRAAA